MVMNGFTHLFGGGDTPSISARHTAAARCARYILTQMI